MICEKCAQELESIVCADCGQTILKLGPYCYNCGKTIDSGLKVVEENGDGPGEIDFSSRILCSDGACIGVVENGVCKTCGKQYVPESDQK